MRELNSPAIQKRRASGEFNSWGESPGLCEETGISVLIATDHNGPGVQPLRDQEFLPISGEPRLPVSV